MQFHCIANTYLFIFIYLLFSVIGVVGVGYERAGAGIDLHVNAHKTEYMCYNQIGDISTLDGTLLKLVDKFTHLGSR